MSFKSMGEIIKSSVAGGWGKENPTGDFTEKVFIIRSADFPGLSVSNCKELPVRYEKTIKVNKSKLEINDVLIEMSGGTSTRPTGRTLLITEDILSRFNKYPIIPASFCRILRFHNEFDPVYCFYWLQNMFNKGRTWSYQNTSTGLSNFQFKVFCENELVDLKTADVQSKIARFLSCLDKKIVLNNQLNDYLVA